MRPFRLQHTNYTLSSQITTKSLEEPSDEPERKPSGLEKFLGSISELLKKNAKIIKVFVLIILNILVITYFILATIFHLDKPKGIYFILFFKI